MNSFFDALLTRRFLVFFKNFFFALAPICARQECVKAFHMRTGTLATQFKVKMAGVRTDF